jgi:hypothetical protein
MMKVVYKCQVQKRYSKNYKFHANKQKGLEQIIFKKGIRTQIIYG